MELKILCPQWGQTHLPTEAFFTKVKEAGYDGVDTWVPEKKAERKEFIRLLDEYELDMVSHQHQAEGNGIDDFCKSFECYLELSLESDPVLINSHSGRDYFTLEQQLKVIDVAENFAVKHGITIAHETHRGRIGFGPVNCRELFRLRPDMKITADLSHWVCVTESFLQHFTDEVDEAVKRTRHMHARVGFPEGPQIPDPRSPFWKREVDFFMQLWERMIDHQVSIGAEVITITAEFGPPPYMWVAPQDNSTLADQWEVNVFMKELLKKHFCD